MFITPWATKRLVSCFLLIIVSCHPSQAEEGQLLWKFQPGDQHHYRMTQTMDMEMIVDATGRKIESSFDQILDMTWEIAKVDEQGLATVLQKVDRVRMDMQAPGQAEMKFDTHAEEAPTGFAAMLSPLYKALTKDPLDVSYTPRGEIKDLKVPEVLTKALQGLPGAAMMREMFSEEGFKQMMQQSSMILPESADLEPGYEWTRITKLKNAQFGEIEVKTTYNYQGTREVQGKSFEAFGVSVGMNFGDSPDQVQLRIVNQESKGEISLLVAKQDEWNRAS